MFFFFLSFVLLIREINWILEGNIRFNFLRILFYLSMIKFVNVNVNKGIENRFYEIVVWFFRVCVIF